MIKLIHYFIFITFFISSYSADTNDKKDKAKEIAAILCQPGEFTLMIISTSLAAGILPREDAQFFLLVCVLGMLMTPIVIKALPSVRNIKS